MTGPCPLGFRIERVTFLERFLGRGVQGIGFRFSLLPRTLNPAPFSYTVSHELYRRRGAHWSGQNEP